jgi:hypothetical protein
MYGSSFLHDGPLSSRPSCVQIHEILVCLTGVFGASGTADACLLPVTIPNILRTLHFFAI